MQILTYIQDHLTSLDEEILLQNKYFGQLVNDVQIRPLDYENAPYCDITIRLTNTKMIPEILEELTNQLFVPFKIGVDFFATASSPNRPLELIYPSVGSTCNKNTLMRSEDDFENLFEEFEEFPHEKMLQGKDQKIARVDFNCIRHQ